MTSVASASHRITHQKRSRMLCVASAQSAATPPTSASEAGAGMARMSARSCSPAGSIGGTLPTAATRTLLPDVHVMGSGLGATTWPSTMTSAGVVTLSTSASWETCSA